jgi:hypothetical protein
MMIRDNTIVCTWTINNIEVTQLLEFATGPNTGRMDSVKISYAVQNKDFQAHEIGVRVLLDTFLGRNDGSPFRIPGVGEVTTETVFQGDKVPDYWYAFDDLGEPSVRAQGTLRAEGLTPPSSILFASWNRFEKNLWDIAPIEGRTFRRSGIGPLDSANAVYWNPVKVDPQGRIGVATMYGLYGATILKGEAFSLSLGGPKNTKGEEVVITADIQKTAQYPATEVVAEIKVPEGLSLAQGDTAVKQIGDIVSNNQVVKQSWALVPDGRAQGEIEYEVTVRGTVEKKQYSVSAKRTLTIDAVIPPPPPPPVEPTNTAVVAPPPPPENPPPPPTIELQVSSMTNFDFSRIDSVIASANADTAEVNALLDEINKALAERKKAKRNPEQRKQQSERAAALKKKADEAYPPMILDASTNFRRVQNVTNKTPVAP